MDNYNYFIFARAIHVIGVILWIGGVAFVTTVLVPALKEVSDAQQRLTLFEKLEGKFAFQARFATLITGASGFYMLHFMNAWDRYHHLQFWWLHLMTFIWAIFTLILFVLEPLILHKWFIKKAKDDSEKTFKILHRMHKVLLFLSLLAVFGAMMGSHGFVFFSQ